MRNEVYFQRDLRLKRLRCFSHSARQGAPRSPGIPSPQSVNYTAINTVIATMRSHAALRGIVPGQKLWPPRRVDGHLHGAGAGLVWGRAGAHPARWRWIFNVAGVAGVVASS